MPITYTSGEQVEVYRFNWPITLGVPATALFLQAWLPQQFPFFAMLDLPLLVTIFFGISRRNPISGLLTGGAQNHLFHYCPRYGEPDRALELAARTVGRFRERDCRSLFVLCAGSL